MKRRAMMNDLMGKLGLPFPTRPLKVQGGFVLEYIIPDDFKEMVLEVMYPFTPLPSLDDEMTDIHEDKEFIVRDYMVVRDNGMDMLVSPYFPESGGTVIDWWSDENTIEFDEDDLAGMA
jgi:hypothetical protein